MRYDLRFRPMVLAMLLAASVAVGTLRAEEFYTLASVQAVTVKEGQALRLTANGPIAFSRLDDPEAPAGVIRVRLKFYGVAGAIEGLTSVTAVGTVTTVPDGRGNLEVTVTLTGGGPGPIVVRPGNGAQDVDVVIPQP